MPANATDFNNINARSIFKSTDERAAAAERENTVLDSAWVNSKFMVPAIDMPPQIANIRFDSSASLKFTDTGLGGSVFVNPRPQYNHMTDPRISTLLDRVGGEFREHNYPSLDMTTKATGMGAGYSATIDDNQEVVFLEFGMPKFNSLIDFFFRAVDYKDSVLANTGRPARAYTVGSWAGTAGIFFFFPMVTITILSIKLLLGALYGDANLKYYYFNPQMHMYWATVNTLVTQLITEQGMLNPVFMDEGVKDAKNTPPGVDKIGMPGVFDKRDVKDLNDMMPGIISENTTYVDVFKVVTKAQRVANRHNAAIYKLLNGGTLDNVKDITLKNFPTQTFWAKANAALTFKNYMKEMNGYSNPAANPGDPLTTSKPKTPTPGADGKFAAEDDKSILIQGYDWAASKLDSVVSGMESSVRQGGAFAAFAVNHTGSSNETFSNSVTSINIGDTAKQLSQKSRALSFDLSRGNLFGSGTIQDLATAATDVLRGVADGVSLNLTNVIQSLTGNAYVEIPKRWDDSSMSFQQKTYTMELRSPYNHKVSQLQNIYIPLCMILAGVLPLATGKSSYTSPYLCTLFNKGVENIKLGMITSVSITRGASTLGFDKKRRALAIDVSFTVTDFSTLVTSPVNSSVFDAVFNPVIEDDTPLGNYLATMGSRDILHNKYASKRLGQRISRSIMNAEMLVNPDRWGMMLGNALESTLGNLVSAGALPNIFKNP